MYLQGRSQRKGNEGAPVSVGGTSKLSAEGASVEVPRGCPLPTGGGGCSPPQKFFLHFHVEMAHFVGILAVNFKFYILVLLYEQISKNTPKSNGYKRIRRDKTRLSPLVNVTESTSCG